MSIKIFVDLVEALLHFSKNKLPVKSNSRFAEDFCQIWRFISFIRKVNKIFLVGILKWK